jgi:hypothetical protein
MNSTIFADVKNLFLIFPPGCGGNHLANMLSMHPVFSQRFIGVAYKNRMLLKYRERFSDTSPTTKIAHFGYLENLQIPEILKNNQRMQSNKTVNLWCAHYAEYFRNGKMLESHLNRSFCIMSYPSEYTIAHQRMTSGTWFNGVDANYENTHTYSSSGFINPEPLRVGKVHLTHIIKCTTDDIFNINTDIFFTHSGYDYLSQMCKSSLGIDLPKECNEMHLLWLNSVIAAYQKVDI